MLKDRKKEIFDRLCRVQKMTVSELAGTFFVSEMTIRRDLAEMEAQGYIRRYRGGAMVTAEEKTLPIDQRMLRDEEEKRRLAQKAEMYLRNHCTVYIDSASICQYIVPHLKKREDVRIVTNSVRTVLAASSFHIPCYLLGGEYFELDMCFLGSVTEEYAKNVNVDVAFLSSRGISEDGVISDISMEQVMLRRCILKHARETVFLFEKGKVGKIYLHTLCRREEAGVILTE